MHAEVALSNQASPRNYDEIPFVSILFRVAINAKPCLARMTMPASGSTSVVPAGSSSRNIKSEHQVGTGQ